MQVRALRSRTNHINELLAALAVVQCSDDKMSGAAAKISASLQLKGILQSSSESIVTFHLRKKSTTSGYC